MKTQFQKGHQRRQSVARLLPDISKLRLLSWLLEASSELINCDIAIMDVIYAKLNKSQESLQYWQSAERLSDKIKNTVMEHNHLQNLLVNIIRHHDQLRDQLNHQKRRQLSLDHRISSSLSQARFFLQHQRIDLADIADALDDGCSCSCHTNKSNEQIAMTVDDIDSPVVVRRGTTSAGDRKASTLPAFLPGDNTSNQSVALIPSVTKKVRRLKKVHDIASTNTNNTSLGLSHQNDSIDQLNRQDILSLLADKLCEDCFETHYWLHSCSLDSIATTNNKLLQIAASTNNNTINNNSDRNSDLDEQEQQRQLESINAVITKRNATFIKLVQQEVRSTISKSIELIDLIRKEFKSPESINHKQLMRWFSTSIQLLTSVGKYVVPSQDISAIIPEAGQQQTLLFSLPTSDFDHLYMNGGYALTAFSQLNSLNQNHHQQQQSQNINQQSSYHLAPVPEIPIRRQINLYQRVTNHSYNGGSRDTSSDIIKSTSAIRRLTPGNININEQQKSSTNLGKQLEANDDDLSQIITADAIDFKTDCSFNQAVESSSGGSSNNSSASSSIARGTVQQSSLTRAHTSNAILDGKTSHDLSLEQIANLSRQHTEDDMMFPSRPKFWQSSKFNFIKKLLHVKQQRLLRQQSKDRRIYNNKVQNKFRLVMMDLTHFNKSQQLLTTENGVNSLLASMRNVLEFGLYLTLKLY